MENRTLSLIVDTVCPMSVAISVKSITQAEFRGAGVECPAMLLCDNPGVNDLTFFVHPKDPPVSERDDASHQGGLT